MLAEERFVSSVCGPRWCSTCPRSPHVSTPCRSQQERARRRHEEAYGGISFLPSSLLLYPLYHPPAHTQRARTHTHPNLHPKRKLTKRGMRSSTAIPKQWFPKQVDIDNPPKDCTEPFPAAGRKSSRGPAARIRSPPAAGAGGAMTATTTQHHTAPPPHIHTHTHSTPHPFALFSFRRASFYGKEFGTRRGLLLTVGA